MLPVLRRQLRLLKRLAVESEREWKEGAGKGNEKGAGEGAAAAEPAGATTNGPASHVQRLRAPSLFDTPRFTRSFERLFMGLWERHRLQALGQLPSTAAAAVQQGAGAAARRQRPALVMTEALLA